MGNVVNAIGSGLSNAANAVGSGLSNAANTVGHFVGDATGYNAQQRADSSSEQAQQDLNQASQMNSDTGDNIAKTQNMSIDQANMNTANQKNTQGQANQANSGALNSMGGGDASRMMSQAQQAASPLAVQQANASAGAGAAGARAAGMNAGQAAMMASQGAGNTYQSALNTGIQTYGNNANQIGQLGSNLGNQANSQGALANQNIGQAQQGSSQYLQRAQNQTNIGAARSGQAQQNQSTANQQGGTALTLVGGLLSSDKNMKTGIKNLGSGRGSEIDKIMQSLARNIDPINYAYKSGFEKTGAPGTQRMGLTAQSLEKTPLADVVQDTDEGKKVDTGQLTMNNTAMIAELIKRLDRIESAVSVKKEQTNG